MGVVAEGVNSVLWVRMQFVDSEGAHCSVGAEAA
jgi:hypothetical protein